MVLVDKNSLTGKLCGHKCEDCNSKDSNCYADLFADEVLEAIKKEEIAFDLKSVLNNISSIRDEVLNSDTTYEINDVLSIIDDILNIVECRGLSIV